MKTKGPSTANVFSALRSKATEHHGIVDPWQMSPLRNVRSKRLELDPWGCYQIRLKADRMIGRTARRARCRNSPLLAVHY